MYHYEGVLLQKISPVQRAWEDVSVNVLPCYCMAFSDVVHGGQSLNLFGSKPCSGRVHWPKAHFLQYPEDLHAIVVACLDTNPQTRPDVQKVLDLTNRALKQGLPR